MSRARKECKKCFRMKGQGFDTCTECRLYWYHRDYEEYLRRFSALTDQIILGSLKRGIKNNELERKREELSSEVKVNKYLDPQKAETKTTEEWAKLEAEAIERQLLAPKLKDANVSLDEYFSRSHGRMLGYGR